MGVLAMLELEGDTKRLLAASDDIGWRLPTPDGLLLRMTAPTEGGMVIFQLWDSPEARRRNAEDAHHSEALTASGMKALVRGSRSRVFDGAVLKHVAGGDAA